MGIVLVPAICLIGALLFIKSVYEISDINHIHVTSDETREDQRHNDEVW